MLKRLFLSLLLLSSVSIAYAQVSDGLEFRFTAEESKESWNSVEENLDLLEKNLLQLEIDNEILTEDLTTLKSDFSILKNYSAYQSLQYQDLKNRYESLEKTTKIWKWSCIGLGSIAIVVTTTILMVNKGK